MPVYVARIATTSDETNTYVFTATEDESEQAAAVALAESFDGELVEVMPIEEFLAGDTYELCTI